MDRTAVGLDGPLQTNTAIHSLTLRDLTIDTHKHRLVDLDRPGTIRLTRCRIVGFDYDRNSSCVFRGDAIAIFAEDCRFEAGYTRGTPGYGALFDVRGSLLARLERCTIKGPMGGLFNRGTRSTCVFESCEFVDLDPSPEGGLASGEAKLPPETVRLDGCKIARSGGQPWELLRRRSLEELNPAWKREPR
jgi:hypothetical protein